MNRFDFSQLLKNFVLSNIALFLFLYSSTFDLYARNHGGNVQGFKLASLNIRYSTEKDSVNKWTNRKDLFSRFIRDTNLDIFCLQEVLYSQLKDICKALPTYSWVGRGRLDGQKGGEFVPIFFQKKKFECVDNGTFWLSENPDSIGSKGWDSSLPRIATWAKLKNVNTNQVFFIINTHLDHKGIVSRQKSMELIKDTLLSLAGSCPIILAGDFNSTTQTTVYQIALYRGKVLKDSYVVSKNKKGVSYTYHNFGKKLPLSSRHRIDFVLVNNELEVDSICIVKEKIENGVYLSDHNPLVIYLNNK